jgi:hypothetical protein
MKSKIGNDIPMVVANKTITSNRMIDILYFDLEKIYSPVHVLNNYINYFRKGILSSIQHVEIHIYFYRCCYFGLNKFVNSRGVDNK